MRKMYENNQWGYDIAKTNPFWIALYNLREVAKESVGEENVLDLSRGDPGYGRAPSKEGREFYSYLVFLDTLFNTPERHFTNDNRSVENCMKITTEETRKEYAPEKAEKMLNMFEEFMERILEISEKQKLNYSKKDIFFNLFKYSTVSGGCYHDPQGEEICRAVIADFYSNELNENIHADDLIFTRGVSDGIGTFFQFMDAREGIGFLTKGDTILSTSPAYSPYNAIFKDRGFNVIAVGIDEKTGDFNAESLQKIEENKERIKLFSLINPNNPTGLVAPKAFQKRIVELAEKNNGIILTDDVYSAFFSEIDSIFNKAKNRTIRLNARSKIERSTGLRFGDYLITEETNKYISENILDGTNLKKSLLLAKAPGGTKGEFMHVAFVSGPSQFMGISHIIFGGTDRESYTALVHKSTRDFAEVLGIKYAGNSYYTVFNMDEISSEAKKKELAEEKFYQLAKRGVVLIPAFMFYAEGDAELKNMARACLPNLTPEKAREAGKIIRKYLES